MLERFFRFRLPIGSCCRFLYGASVRLVASCTSADLATLARVPSKCQEYIKRATERNAYNDVVFAYVSAIVGFVRDIELVATRLQTIESLRCRR
jgi:hypothetical protein